MTDFDQETQVARAWDGNARAWSHDVRAGYDRYRELFTFPAFLSFLPDLTGSTVIDLGCGEGRNTRAMAQVPGFADSFQCAADTPMNPAKRCAIW